MDHVTLVERTIDNPDTYRWPARPRWGLPEEVMDRSLPAGAQADDALLFGDVTWTAWAFAGARCARTFWRLMGHQLVSEARLNGARAAVHDVLRWAHLGGWLTPDAGRADVAFEWRPQVGKSGGLRMLVRGIEPDASEAFTAGWQVAAARIAERTLAEGTWR